MKKILIVLCFILLSGYLIGASQNDFVDTPDKAYQFQMNGKWLPAVNPLHVGANNYTDVKNLRPTDSGYETVEGFTKINTTATDPPINVHHFSKEGESHVIAKIFEDPDYYLYDNNGTIPNQNDFQATALKQVSSGLGSFTNGPQGTMFYADSENSLVWGGYEMRAPLFLVSDDSDADGAKDLTEKINKGLEGNSVQVGGGGNDTYTVLLLHGEGTSGGTTITDSSTGGADSPHTAAVTVSGDTETTTDAYKFGVSSIFFENVSSDDDYLSITDSDDWYFGGDFAIDFWFRNFSEADVGGIFQQRVDDDNIVYFRKTAATTFEFVVRSAAAEIVSLSSNSITITGGFNHFAIVRNVNAWALFHNGTVKDTEVSAGAYPNLAAAFEIGRTNYGGATTYKSCYIDEFRISKGVPRFGQSGFSPPAAEYTNSARYMFIGSPLKLNGIKIYLDNANTITQTMASAFWSGSIWTSNTITDNTSAGGVSLSQDGTITWTYTEEPQPRYLSGSVMYFYRFDAGSSNAAIRKITVSAPLQDIRDVWNRAPRTCISFQFYDSPMFEDYTFQVSEKDSTDSSIYAAAIGGMSQTNDYLDIMFDDRSMGIRFDMLSSKVNSSAIMISSVEYWDGAAFQTVGYFSDGTLDSGGTESFAKSGVVSWTPPSSSEEFPKEVYGVTGYVYRIKLTGAVAVTADTSIDLVTGITAPLDMTGYNIVGTYNRRVMLIDGNRVDYSQTDTPWVFNGVDSSDNGRLSLYFGDDNPITATGSIYNRYGSNLIEAWIATKSNSTYTLTGVQPYSQYDNPFIIKEVSQNIGCAAPMSFASAVMEIGDGLRMGVSAWLDFSGPIAFNGAEPIRIEGIENFFDLAETTHLNYSYINKATSYIDTIHDEWNLSFPTGDSTSNSKWVVYSFKYKKWYEKAANVGDVVLWDGSGDAVLWDSSGDSVLWDSGQYLTCSTGVIDTNGARYNYGFLSTGYMMRLDNGSTWDNSEIAQQIRTGYFSPPVADDFGFWTKSEVRGLRLISGAMTENRAVLASILNDGVLSSNSLQIDLDSGKPISKNYKASHNLSEQADTYQVDFTTSTSVNKWEPLAWGYRARIIRED